MLNLKIAELRKKNNMTQQELGDVLSVSYQTISKWENGIVRYLKEHFGEVAMTKFGGIMISYGWKA